MPRTAVVIDPVMCLVVASIGGTYDDLAALVHLSASQVSRRINQSKVLREAWAEGRANARLSVRRAQYKSALHGSAAMLRWLGINELKQADRSDHLIDAHLTSEKPARWIARFQGMDDPNDPDDD